MARLSIYNPDHLESFIARLQTVHPETERQWGKMTASQMMKHLRMPLGLMEGPPAKRPLLFRLIGGMIRKQVLDESPFKRNSPTGPGMEVKDHPDLAAEREQLIVELRRIASAGPAAVDGRMHSIFGKMSAQEWDLLQVKHLEHHLSQFGA